MRPTYVDEVPAESQDSTVVLQHPLVDLVSGYLKSLSMTGADHEAEFERVATALTENYEMVEELLQLCHRAVAIKR